MVKKGTYKNLRTVWLRQLKEATKRADERERECEKRAAGNSKDVLVLNKKEFAQFMDFLLKQGGREALIDLLEDEGPLEESLRLSVEYYVQGV
ncbi:MAG: hypothetical protein IJQ01_06210 [Selenomonadaceae bacterium]|nr:hypothetical protein [Selenomonadaceae bacterium]